MIVAVAVRNHTCLTNRLDKSRIVRDFGPVLAAVFADRYGTALFAVVAPHITFCPLHALNSLVMRMSVLGFAGGPVRMFITLPSRQYAVATLQSSPAVFQFC